MGGKTMNKQQREILLNRAHGTVNRIETPILDPGGLFEDNRMRLAVNAAFAPRLSFTERLLAALRYKELEEVEKARQNALK